MLSWGGYHRPHISLAEAMGLTPCLPTSHLGCNPHKCKPEMLHLQAPWCFERVGEWTTDRRLECEIESSKQLRRVDRERERGCRECENTEREQKQKRRAAQLLS